MIRTPKKSDTIEVRLPHAVKRAFMERCRAEGRTASDVVRGFVEAQLSAMAPAPSPTRRWFRPAAAAGMLVALALAMPSAVAAGPDFRPGFLAVDRNHDGVLTPDEFGPRRHDPIRGCGPHRVLALPLRHAAMPEVRGLRPFAVSAPDFDIANADSNQDGKVSFGEYVKHRLRMYHAGFTELDSDHDGRLTPKEYAAGWSSFLFRGEQPDVAPFQELDRNSDGTVSWSEFLA